MSGDWIKMRTNLWDDPRVSRICDITGHPEAFIIGGLYWLWAMADSHSEDGMLPGLTPGAIDRKTGIKGLGDALVDPAVRWIEFSAEGARIIRFEEHNGASAKRRSMEAKRKGEIRKVSASDADKMQTDGGQNAEGQRTETGQDAELEKRRIKEKKTPSPLAGADASPPGFAEFWEAYPRKVSKPHAVKAWRKLNLDMQALPAILAGVKRDRQSAQWQRDNGEYIPHPATWLNGRRWEDAREAPAAEAPTRSNWL